MMQQGQLVIARWAVQGLVVKQHRLLRSYPNPKPHERHAYLLCEPECGTSIAHREGRFATEWDAAVECFAQSKPDRHYPFG